VNRQEKKELLLSAVSGLSEDNISDFVKYDDFLTQKPGYEPVIRPVLRVVGAAAICAVVLGSLFLGLKYIEYKSDIINSQTTEAAESTEEEKPEPVSEEEDYAHRFDWQYEYDFEYDSGSMPGDYMYNDAMVNGCTLLLKRNVHTGECTPVCTVPSCKHDSAECPFYGTTCVVGIGNIMYGSMKDEKLGKWVVYSYDPETDKKDIIAESAAKIYELISYKYYLYCKRVDTGFTRIDTKTGEFTKVRSQYDYSVSSIHSGMMIWSKDSSGSPVYVSTDLLGENARSYDPHIFNGKLHKVIENADGSSSYAQLDRSGKIEKIMAEDSCYAIPIGENMLSFGAYTDGETHWIDPDDHSKGRRLANGDIYITPLNGGESRLLCHIDGYEPRTAAIACANSKNVMICGDWIAIMTPQKISDNEPGNNNRMILLNMKTGEYHISRYTE
jgi:hypothetical protein